MLGHLLFVVLIIIQSRGKCLKGSAFLHVIIMGIDLLGHAHFLSQLSLSLPIVKKLNDNFSLSFIEFGYGIVKKNVSFVFEALLFWVEAIVYKSVFEFRTVFEHGFEGKQSAFPLLLVIELMVRFRKEQDAFLLRKGERGLKKAFVHRERDLYGFSGLLGDNLHCYYLDSHRLSSFQENRQMKRVGCRCLSIRSCSPNQVDS